MFKENSSGIVMTTIKSGNASKYEIKLFFIGIEPISPKLRRIISQTNG